MKLQGSKKAAATDFIIISFLIALLLLILSSCEHTNDLIPAVDTTMNENNYSGPIPCDTDTVYFNNTILPLLISNCAKSGCHNAATAQEGIVLDSYSNLMASGQITPGKPTKGKIVKAINETDPDDIMPPPGNTPLTQEQKDQIAIWISQGAKNNYCNDCDTTNVSYTNKIKGLMDLKCKGCHNNNNAPLGINLSDYAGVKSAAQSGQLLGSVKHQSPYSPMPKGGNQLPSCEIDMITIWIQNQYPQ